MLSERIEEVAVEPIRDWVSEEEGLLGDTAQLLGISRSLGVSMRIREEILDLLCRYNERYRN